MFRTSLARQLVARVPPAEILPVHLGKAPAGSVMKIISGCTSHRLPPGSDETGKKPLLTSVFFCRPHWLGAKKTGSDGGNSYLVRWTKLKREALSHGQNILAMANKLRHTASLQEVNIISRNSEVRRRINWYHLLSLRNKLNVGSLIL